MKSWSIVLVSNIVAWAILFIVSLALFNFNLSTLVYVAIAILFALVVYHIYYYKNQIGLYGTFGSCKLLHGREKQFLIRLLFWNIVRDIMFLTPVFFFLTIILLPYDRILLLYASIATVVGLLNIYHSFLSVDRFKSADIALNNIINDYLREVNLYHFLYYLSKENEGLYADLTERATNKEIFRALREKKELTLQVNYFPIDFILTGLGDEKKDEIKNYIDSFFGEKESETRNKIKVDSRLEPLRYLIISTYDKISFETIFNNTLLYYGVFGYDSEGTSNKLLKNNDQQADKEPIKFLGDYYLEKQREFLRFLLSLLWSSLCGGEEDEKETQKN